MDVEVLQIDSALRWVKQCDSSEKKKHLPRFIVHMTLGFYQKAFLGHDQDFRLARRMFKLLEVFIFLELLQCDLLLQIHSARCKTRLAERMAFENYERFFFSALTGHLLSTLTYEKDWEEC